MGRKYTHLTLAERIELFCLHKEGRTIRQIATSLGRSPSTVSRELRRNAKKTKQYAGGYEPERANQLAIRRRTWDARFKLQRQPELRQQVKHLLNLGWSPEQISGRLAQHYQRKVISHESIYRFVYHRSAQKDYWHKLLPRARFRRGRHSRRVEYALSHLKRRRSIHDRPNISNCIGHWEADLMLFSEYGLAVLVNYDKHSKLALAIPQDKTARSTRQHLYEMFRALPPTHRQTLTLDNGTEFAQHDLLEQQTGIKSYFCDLRAPWQKGGVENVIGRLRRALPRCTSKDELTKANVTEVIRRYNNTPRKCLDYKTPTEVFLQSLNLLHFKRESTFQPALE